jgi:hypothetical protein
MGPDSHCLKDIPEILFKELEIVLVPGMRETQLKLGDPAGSMRVEIKKDRKGLKKYKRNKIQLRLYSCSLLFLLVS